MRILYCTVCAGTTGYYYIHRSTLVHLDENYKDWTISKWEVPRACDSQMVAICKWCLAVSSSNKHILVV
jgi:hypothetical protein